MRMQAAVIAFVKILALLLIYKGCLGLLNNFQTFFLMPPISQLSVFVFWSTPLGLVVGELVVIRLAEPISFCLVGKVGHESIAIPDATNF